MLTTICRASNTSNRHKLALAATVFAVCSTSLVTTAMGKTTLTYFTWGGNAELATRKQQIDIFEAENPGIKIKLQASSSYDDQLPAMCAAGIAPDIVNVCNDLLHVRGKLFADLNPMIKADKSFRRSEIYSVAMDTMRYGDAQIALPFIAKPTVNLINIDLLYKAGLKAPVDGWTWDDLMTIGTKTTSVSSEGKRTYGIAGISPITTVWGFGGDFYNADRTGCIINSPESLKGLTYFLDLINRWQVAPRRDWGDVSAFTLGKSAVTEGMSWEIGETCKTIKNKFRWNLMTFPQDAQGHRKSDTRVDGLSISLSCKHKKEAYRFLRFMTLDKRAQTLQMKDGVPILNSVAATDTYTSWSPYTGVTIDRSVYLQTLAFGAIQPFGGSQRVIAENWRAEISKAIAGKQSAIDVLRKFQDKANQILKKPGSLN